MNAGRPASTDYLGPLMIQPGEQITTELIGPPTTSYIEFDQLPVSSAPDRRMISTWSCCSDRS